MSGLLDGLRVLDLSVWRPGPYATQLLAEIGADVIKVEPPGGDPMRAYPELFESLHANKRSAELDLKDDHDRGRALELASGADAVIEGFRPGVVARLGVAYEVVRELNPAVVYCSLSGMGQFGPLALAPAHDLNYQAWAGALRPDGGAPEVGKLPIADLSGGAFAAFAVCAALLRRARTGEGEYIDLAMADVLATWTGAVPPRAEGVGPAARGVPGYGIFEAANGESLALSIITEDHFWSGLCEVLDLGDVAGLGFAERMARLEELQQRIADAIRERERDALVETLLAADVPVAPVLDRGGMLELPHFRARGVSTSDPWSDGAVGFPVRFTQHPARRDSAPPTLDQHRGASFAEVTVRSLQASDDRVVDALLADVLGRRTRFRLGETRDVPDRGGFGAWHGDRLLGVVTHHDEEIDAIAVRGEAGRRSIGGKLVETVVSALRADGRSEVWVALANDELDAMRLFQRHGFRMAELRAGGLDRARAGQPAGPVVGNDGIERHDALVFRRALRP